MSTPRAILYTRQGCHLCDEAHAVLLAHGITPQIVDIDTDPRLKQLYDQWVPVVELDGKVRFRGKVDSKLLRRILRAG